MRGLSAQIAHASLRGYSNEGSLVEIDNKHALQGSCEAVGFINSELCAVSQGHAVVLIKVVRVVRQNSYQGVRNGLVLLLCDGWDGIVFDC